MLLKLFDAKEFALEATWPRGCGRLIGERSICAAKVEEVGKQQNNLKEKTKQMKAPKKSKKDLEKIIWNAKKEMALDALKPWGHGSWAEYVSCPAQRLQGRDRACDQRVARYEAEAPEYISEMSFFVHFETFCNIIMRYVFSKEE